MSLEEIIQDVYTTLDDIDVDVEESEVEKQVKELREEYMVPEDQLFSTAINIHAEQKGLSSGDVWEEITSTETQTVDIEELEDPETWVSLEVKVVNTRYPDSDSITQSGTIGDETGMISYVSFSEIKLEENQAYKIENAVTNEYNSELQVVLNNNTEPTKIDKPIEPQRQTRQLKGVVTAIQPQSGLVKRCTECNKILDDQKCDQHPNQETEKDLRTKMILNNGQPNIVYLDEQNTEQATEMVGTEITLEKAKQIARDKLDREETERKLEETLIGKHFKIETNKPIYGDYHYPETIKKWQPKTPQIPEKYKQNQDQNQDLDTDTETDTETETKDQGQDVDTRNQEDTDTDTEIQQSKNKDQGVGTDKDQKPQDNEETTPQQVDTENQDRDSGSNTVSKELLLEKLDGQEKEMVNLANTLSKNNEGLGNPAEVYDTIEEIALNSEDLEVVNGRLTRK